ncbi:MAG: SprT-like domain-containing protein [Sedimenticolaceae bacterium]
MSEFGGDIRGRIEKRTLQVLRQAEPLCASRGARLPDPIIRFDLRGQAAGQAQWRQGQRPLLRYNLDIAHRHQADFLATTVTHEVAHLVTAACHGRTRPHGPEWRAVMAYLGIPDAGRCHNYRLDDTAVKRQRRWAYRCDCSNHELSTTRHKRTCSGATRYHCRRCHAVLRPAEPADD